jgi:hypothetical protein
MRRPEAGYKRRLIKDWRTGGDREVKGEGKGEGEGEGEGGGEELEEGKGRDFGDKQEDHIHVR